MWGEPTRATAPAGEPMLLTISINNDESQGHRPASDLGYLLHKHPAKVQSFNLTFGAAHVFYPAADEHTCECCLLLDVDPVGLVRGKGDRTLDQYVNDRPYVASSMMSVALSQVYGTAMAGNCKEKPDLVAQPLPLKARIESIACTSRGLSQNPNAPSTPSGPEGLLRRLFEPLGYQVSLARHRLDPNFPDWGDSSIFTLELTGLVTLKQLLGHLYVLIPVLDNDKHYFVGDAEVEKLMRHASAWLGAHPERELITRRYLKHKRELVDDALTRLREQDGESHAETDRDRPDDPNEEATERKLSLHDQRHAVVLSALQAKGAKSVIDLGCGEGRLLKELLKYKQFERIVGMDVSGRALQIAIRRLHYNTLPPLVRARIELMLGSLMYKDDRMAGFDAAVLCEVIEHMDEPRLQAMERVVFGHAMPRTVIITTPNREYNSVWETLAAGSMRHRDHRFEWTRAEFQAWCDAVCARTGYTVSILPIGPEAEGLGAPTQMGVFQRGGDS